MKCLEGACYHQDAQCDFRSVFSLRPKEKSRQTPEYFIEHGRAIVIEPPSAWAGVKLEPKP